jgi:hypothetical protein
LNSTLTSGPRAVARVPAALRVVLFALFLAFDFLAAAFFAIARSPVNTLP